MSKFSMPKFFKNKKEDKKGVGKEQVVTPSKVGSAQSDHDLDKGKKILNDWQNTQNQYMGRKSLDILKQEMLNTYLKHPIIPSLAAKGKVTPDQLMGYSVAQYMTLLTALSPITDVCFVKLIEEDKLKIDELVEFLSNKEPGQYKSYSQQLSDRLENPVIKQLVEEGELKVTDLVKMHQPLVKRVSETPQIAKLVTKKVISIEELDLIQNNRHNKLLFQKLAKYAENAELLDLISKSELGFDLQTKRQLGRDQSGALPNLGKTIHIGKKSILRWPPAQFEAFNAGTIKLKEELEQSPIKEGDKIQILNNLTNPIVANLYISNDITSKYLQKPNLCNKTNNDLIEEREAEIGLLSAIKELYSTIDDSNEFKQFNKLYQDEFKDFSLALNQSKTLMSQDIKVVAEEILEKTEKLQKIINDIEDVNPKSFGSKISKLLGTISTLCIKICRREPTQEARIEYEKAKLSASTIFQGKSKLNSLLADMREDLGLLVPKPETQTKTPGKQSHVDQLKKERSVTKQLTREF